MFAGLVLLCLVSTSHLFAMGMRFECVDYSSSRRQKMSPTDPVMRRASSQAFVPESPSSDLWKHLSVPLLKSEEGRDTSFFGLKVRITDISLNSLSVTSFGSASVGSQLIKALLSWYDLPFHEQWLDLEHYAAGAERRMTL